MIPQLSVIQEIAGQTAGAKLDHCSAKKEHAFFLAISNSQGRLLAANLARSLRKWLIFLPAFSLKEELT